jgi:pimeloyl-ACP methyl ester carboxylesterase
MTTAVPRPASDRPDAAEGATQAIQAAPPGDRRRRSKKKSGLELQCVRIHGHDVTYRTAGSGPVVILVHGIASSSETWGMVMPALANRVTVVAPDLLGHGGSTKHAGDYSLGALATGIRDLMIALGHDRATLVGHSLGGGVVLQFAYQFPDRCERLVLVGSGGLGKEVALHLRALSIPGVEYLLAPAFTPRLQMAGTTMLQWLGRVGLRPSPYFEQFWRGYGSLLDRATRRAFFHTLHSVVDPRGQRVSALDRLYLASGRPTVIIWGERDPVIPVGHAHAAHEAMPGSVLHILEDVGHFPQLEQPEGFVRVVLDFIDSTRPAARSEAQLGELLQNSETRDSRSSVR